MLQDNDQVPFVKDFTHLQNRAVLLIDGLDALDTITRGRVESWWRRRAMCTEEERALGREMVTLGVYRPVVIVEDMELLFDQIKEEDEHQC